MDFPLNRNGEWRIIPEVRIQFYDIQLDLVPLCHPSLAPKPELYPFEHRAPERAQEQQASAESALSQARDSRYADSKPLTPVALPRDLSPTASDRWAGYVSVIVPVYNEVAHLEELLAAVLASPAKKEIVIVDDGSTDGTREKLQELARMENVTIVFHEKNYGKGASIRTALNYARGEYVLIQDSDLEYDPGDYPALLRPLQEGTANVVYGVRPDRPERGLRFFLGAKLLTHLTNLLYGAGIHDEATCYKVFRRSTLMQIALRCRRFEFCPEVTAKLCRMGEHIAEVPIHYNPRSADEGKKIRHSDGWLAIWTLIRYRFALRRSCRRDDSGQPVPFAISFSSVARENESVRERA